MRGLVLLVVLFLSACSAGSSDTDADSAVRAALLRITTGINREDVLLASQPVSSRFQIGANVRSRYSAADWNSGNPGDAEFRGFFGAALLTLANVQQSMEITDLDVQGEVATAHVDAGFDALRILPAPAENVTYRTSDVLVFELEGGSWRLVSWDEVPSV
jgi:hypothetical protein